MNIFIDPKHRLSLTDHMAAVDRAEAALSEARNALKARAVQRGIATAGIFETSSFVKRSSAEAWVSESRTEGFNEGYAEGRASVRRATDDDDETGDDDDPGRDDDRDEGDSDDEAARKRKAKKAKKIADEANDDDESDDTEAVALAVVNAGRARRGEKPLRRLPVRVVHVPRPAASAASADVKEIADAIVRAGKRRRGEEV
jgi:hypothetical protein